MLINTEKLKKEEEDKELTLDDYKELDIKEFLDNLETPVYLPNELSSLIIQKQEWARTQGRSGNKASTPYINSLAEKMGTTRIKLLKQIDNIVDDEVATQKAIKEEKINGCDKC